MSRRMANAILGAIPLKEWLPEWLMRHSAPDIPGAKALTEGRIHHSRHIP